MGKRSNWKEFETILKNHGIKKLYHFTDRDNLESIIRHGGLYSWADCAEKGIKIPKPGGGNLSRQLDERDGLQHYVRVCFTTQHPMMYVAMNDGRISNPVILEIDPEVIYDTQSRYADMNATRTGAHLGGNIDDFNRIHFGSVKAHKHFDLDAGEQPYFQAEVLVKNFIPLKYITNIGNFGIPIPSQPTQLQSKDAYSAQITRATQHLDAISSRAFNIPKPTFVPQKEKLSTKVTKEDLENGVKDEYGAIYSADGSRLLKVPSELDEYHIREGARVICDSAFSWCKNLTSIELPSSITYIGNNPFIRCVRLHVENRSPLFETDSDALYTKGKKQLISFFNRDIVHFRIPSSVTHIGDEAFSGCKGLTSIELPSSVTHIGDEAFSWCDSLTSIELPSSVTHIGEGAFSCCYSLTSLVLPSSVTHIGNDVFRGDCWNGPAPISSIYVPKGTKGKFMKLLPSEFHDKIIER